MSSLVWLCFSEVLGMKPSASGTEALHPTARAWSWGQNLGLDVCVCMQLYQLSPTLSPHPSTQMLTFASAFFHTPSRYPYGCFNFQSTVHCDFIKYDENAIWMSLECHIAINASPHLPRVSALILKTHKAAILCTLTSQHCECRPHWAS